MVHSNVENKRKTKNVGGKPEQWWCCVAATKLHRCGRAHQVGSAKWDSVGRTKTPSASTGRRRWCPTLCVTWWGRAAVWAAPRVWATVSPATWEGPNEAAAKEEEKEAEAPPVIKEVLPIPTAGKRRQALDEGTCRAHPPLSLTATAHVIKTGRLPPTTPHTLSLSLTYIHTVSVSLSLSTNPTVLTTTTTNLPYHVDWQCVTTNHHPKTGRDLFIYPELAVMAASSAYIQLQGKYTPHKRNYISNSTSTPPHNRTPLSKKETKPNTQNCIKDCWKNPLTRQKNYYYYYLLYTKLLFTVGEKRWLIIENGRLYLTQLSKFNSHPPNI